MSFSTLKNVALKPATWGLFLIASSISLHTRQYLFNRSLWFDEAMNAFNIIGKSYRQLLDKLEYGQGIPAGFLFIEKFLIDNIDNNEYVLRLFPFLSGVFSVILFYLLIKHYLNSSSIILSVFFFSITDSLIYYSSEVKPYSSDVFISLVLLLAVFYYDSRESRSAPLFCAVTGALAVWVSYSSVFVLSGLGVTLIIYYLYRRDLSKLIQFIFICAIWSLSFLLLYHLSIKNQISTELVQDWHNNFNSFAPFPPLSSSDFKWYFNAFFNIFTDPLSFQYKYLAGILYLLGCLAVFVKNKKQFFFLVSPVVMTLIVSGFQKYPFSQRTLLFLAPFFLYLIAEGILLLYGRSALFGILLTAVLVFHPLYNAGKYFIAPRTHEDIKPLLAKVKQSWKEGDRLYIDSWITDIQFKYYKDRFGFNENDYKALSFKSFFSELPEEKSVWLLTSHSSIDFINQLSRYLKMFGEEMSFDISPNTAKRVNADSALFHYRNFQGRDEGQLIVPGIGEWQGFYNDSWTNGDLLIRNLNYQPPSSYRFLILVLNDFNPLKPDFKEMGLEVYINDESIPFTQISGSKYIFRLPSALQQINTIRIKSKTFVPKAININEDDRELGVNINYIMLSNAEYFFYPWEIHNGIIPGIPNNIPVRFRWSQIRSSMSVEEFLHNNSRQVLFLKCFNPDITKIPVKVTLLIDNAVIKNFVFDNNEWHSVSLKTINFENKKTLSLQVSRTWSPKAFGLSGDDRELGVALALPSAE